MSFNNHSSRKDLEDQIILLNEEYRKGNSLVSDAEYDSLLQKYCSMYPSNRLRDRGAVNSIQPFYDWSGLRGFCCKVCESAGQSVEFVAQPKVDGVSLELRYENSLVGCFTRGNNVMSSAIYYIDNLPLFVPDFCFSLRAEVYISKKHFASLGKGVSARDVVAGGLNSKVKRLPKKIFSFVVFDVEMSDTHFDALEQVQTFFPVVPTLKRWTGSDITLTDEFRHSFDYETDGIVVKVNDKKLCERLGNTHKVPRWAIALKYSNITHNVRVQEVIYDIGRTGYYTPVALLDSIIINKRKVDRISLSNFSFVEKQSIGPGSVLEIELKGGTIPSIVRVLSTAEVSLLKKCLYCGGDLKRNTHLRCDNEDCSGRKEKCLLYAAGALGMKGVGESVVRTLISAGVEDLVDLLLLDHFQLFSIFGSQKKSFALAASIQECRSSLDGQKLLCACGIPMLSRANIQKLSVFYSIDNLLMQLHEDGKEEIIRLVGKSRAFELQQFVCKNKIFLSKLLTSPLKREFV